MRLLVLVPGPWKIVAELEQRGSPRCSVIDDILGLGANYARMRAGLVAQLQMVAKEGVANRPWIEVASSTDPKVYKIVKGDLRLYFIFVDGCVLLCSRCAVKKTQKTERKHVRHALRAHDRYRRAVDAQELVEEREHEKMEDVFGSFKSGGG